MTISWIYLIAAGLLEITWATLLKLSDGFSKLEYTIPTIIVMVGSFYYLSQAIKTLPLGTSYAIWTGIGALGATIVGVLYFKEPMTAVRLIFVTLLLVGIVGLKFTSSN